MSAWRRKCVFLIAIALIAGFFEGGIAEWLRAQGIDERRTAMSSACGKIAGCLFGSGAVLTVESVVGVL